MRIVQNIDKKEKELILECLYKSFDTGFDFEDFLKPFLEAIGLSEVVVTKKTGDGGVDLLGVKAGLDELDGNDNVQYKVQAKRNKPSSIVAPEKIDALRGNLGFNQKGLFITTARVSAKAKLEAKTKDPSKPVIVIDGMDLVDICIQKQIACVYRPVFSSDALKDFLGKHDDESNKKDDDEVKTINTSSELQFVSKLITANDIRARIISMPSVIVEKISNNTTKHNVSVLINKKEKILTFNPSRNYLGSVTEVLKEHGLIKKDGTYEEKNAQWAVDQNQIIILNIF